MKILLATDGSDTARLASDFLVNFPFPDGSTVAVLTVIDMVPYLHEDPGELSEEQRMTLKTAEHSRQDDSKQLITSESERLRNAGLGGAAEIRSGDPVEEIIKTAEELKVDLVVLGSHGLSGIRHFLLGSVSERVLEYAQCSVLIVKNTARTGKAFGRAPDKPGPGELQSQWRLLVAYDNTEPSRKALAMCASLPLDERAEVTAVTILPMVTAYRQDIKQQLNTIWKQKKRAATAALEGAVAGLRWSTPHVTTELHEASDVALAIIDMAEKSATDLIVVGNKGKSTIRKFLLGSRTSRIARHAPCSVWALHI